MNKTPVRDVQGPLGEFLRHLESLESNERHEVLDTLNEYFCFQCGGADCGGWCTYDSGPWD